MKLLPLKRACIAALVLCASLFQISRASAQTCQLSFPNGNTLTSFLVDYPSYPNSDALFNATVGSGQPLPAGVYLGWCVDANTVFDPTQNNTVTGTTYTGALYPTCDSNLNNEIPTNHPATCYVSPAVWQEVNYILNHKNGAYFWTIQTAINELVGGPPLGPSPPYPPYDTNEVAVLLAQAASNAPTWVPTCGSVVGAMYVMTNQAGVGLTNPLQLIILEVPVCPITFTVTPPSTNLGCNPSSIPDCTNPVNTNVVSAVSCCGRPVTISCSDSTSTVGCQSIRYLTYTATDGYGNVATYVQTITWTTDTIAPTITTCAPSLTLTNGQTVPAPNTSLVSATDNCAGTPVITWGGDVTNGICPTIITRTYIATDACGNTNTCTETITIVCVPTLTVSCAGDSGTVGEPYSSSLSVSGGCAPYTFSIISGALPGGLMLNTNTGAITGTPTNAGSFSYIAQVKDSCGNTATTASENCGITITSQCNCSLENIDYNFNGTQIIFQSTPGGSYVWFTSDGTVSGLPATNVTLLITDQTITIPATGSSPQYTVPVPDAYVTFSSNVTVATTFFDTVNNVWRISLPPSGLAGNVFFGGAAFKVPVAGLPGGIQNVAWSGKFITTTPGLSIHWQWHAAAYSDFTSNYNAIAPKPVDDNKASIYQSSDQSGTPEGTDSVSGKLWKTFVIGGASGGGGGNYTGSGSSTIQFPPCICSVTPPPLPCVVGDDTATIGFWHNKNGQALIDAQTPSTALANWLAANFPYLYGANAGSNNLTGKTDSAVAALFMQFFGVSGQKTQAQIMAGALAAYVTDSTLAGNSAAGYGFNVSPTGTGAKTYNTGSDGTAIGLLNNTSYTVLQLLQQANLDMKNGTFNANAFNDIFSGINQTGDIN